MRYQHCDYLPKYTSRQDFIKAGYNVGCIWQPVGNVLVKNGQNVTFQAGNYVDVTRGFDTEPGAVFEMKIGDCKNVPSNALNDTDIIYYDNTAFFTCDWNLNNAIFTSTGFSYYRVRIFDTWGEKVYDNMGYIDEIYTLYTNGFGIWTDVSQGEWTVLLQLFNCSYSEERGFSLFYEYVDPCVPTNKTDETSSPLIFNGTNNETDGLTLFPNPATNLIWLKFVSTNDEKMSFKIFNELGELVFSEPEMSFLKGNQSHIIPTDFLRSGLYYLQAQKGTTKFIKKFTIIRT